MLIGTMTWAYYKLSHDALPAFVAEKADRVFPYFLTTKVPAGLAGLFMASLFASAMSMLSSDLNCLSVVGVEDCYRKLRPQATDKQRLAMGKLIVGVCGTLAVLVAVLINLYSERVLSFYFTMTSIVAGGLAGLFLLAFLSPRANRQGAYCGIVACLLFTAYATLTSGGKDRVLDLGAWNFTWHSVMIGVIGHLVLLIVGYVASFAFPASDARAMTLWGWLERKKA
jgi:SSS family solute:Na+ symporter